MTETIKQVKSKKKMSRGRKIGIICSSVLLGLIIVIFSAYMGIGFYFYNFALNPFSKAKTPTTESSNTMPPMLEKNEWLSSVAGQEKVSITNDKLTLRGIFIASKTDSHKYVIAVHGYKSKNTAMSNTAYNFYEKGYNVLLPNLRGHGDSDGKYIGMGWDDRRDILKWIDLIVEKDKESEICLIGVSMGAATVMMTVGENLPTNVKVAVEDCGYTSAYDQFTYTLTKVMKLPEFPIMAAATMVSEMMTGYNLKDASAINQLKKSKTPMLFVHGDKDDFVPFSMMDELYNANTTIDKEKIVVENAAHAYASTVDADLYWNGVWNFVEKYIV